jgi:hypothetical protein
MGWVVERCWPCMMPASVCGENREGRQRYIATGASESFGQVVMQACMLVVRGLGGQQCCAPEASFP